MSIRNNKKLRREIASRAARLILDGVVSEFYLAKEQAIEQLGLTTVQPASFPNDSDVRAALRSLAAGDSERPTATGGRPWQATVLAHKDDPYKYFEALLIPLENVKQDPRYHPEGDVLYHSLQVFDHARDEAPYDEEFLIAALLHDVGKCISPRDHVNAGLEALDGFLSERTAWLIEFHMHCHLIADGTLGARVHRRLRQSEWYDDLILLGQCDRAGRQAGVEAPELEEALDYLRELGGMFD